MTNFMDQPVTVSIARMRQLDDLDGITRGEADFFSRVTIEGQVFNGKKFDGRDDLLPGSAWTFTKTAGQNTVPIKIEIFEDDDPGDDTTVDINPASGKRVLNLALDFHQGIVINTDTQETIGRANEPLVLRGAGDSDKGEIQFVISGQNERENSSSHNPTISQEFFEFDKRSSYSLGRGGAVGHNGLAVGDFDNNGSDDLAMASRGQNAHTLYGLSGGSAFGGRQSFNRIGFNINSPNFAVAVAAGNVNGDLFDDLVIGGDITVVASGSANGLSSNRRQLIAPDPFIAFNPNSQFGTSLLVADLDGDRFDDVLIGAPRTKNVVGKETGAIQINFGGQGGISGRQNVLFRDTPGILGTTEDGDRFGSAIAVGDLNGDGFKDLAVGAPGAGDLVDNAGGVHILYGSATGFAPVSAQDPIRDQILAQSFLGLPSDAGDGFGSTLAVGDFDANGVDDLAVGAPGDRFNGNINNAGSVYIYYGQRNQDLNITRAQRVVQTIEMSNAPEAGDRFGGHLLAKDINSDRITDLVISATGEDSGQGIVHLMLGSFSGITTSGNRVLSQNTPGMVGTAENFDNFGASVAIGNFDGPFDSFTPEIAIAVPEEDYGTFTDAGIINTKTLEPRQFFSSNIQSTFTMKGVSKTGNNSNGLIVGNALDNEIRTLGGDDIAIGGKGNDTLSTGAGDDLIDGGKDSDVYVGGGGRDVFVLRPNAGVDMIQDLQNGIDYIGLAGGLEFEDLRIVGQGNNTILRANGNRLAVLEGVKSNSIMAEDFVPVGLTQIKGIAAPVVLV